MRKMNSCRYVPKHECYADLPPSTYTRDDRKPIYWLHRDNNDLFFINDSEKVLDYVIGGSGGCVSYDDGVLSVENAQYRYEMVQPGEAVKIHEYDDYYDRDYLLQASVTIVSGGEEIQLLGKVEKSGVKGQNVLVFEG